MRALRTGDRASKTLRQPCRLPHCMPVCPEQGQRSRTQPTFLQQKQRLARHMHAGISKILSLPFFFSPQIQASCCKTGCPSFSLPKIRQAAAKQIRCDPSMPWQGLWPLKTMKLFLHVQEPTCLSKQAHTAETHRICLLEEHIAEVEVYVCNLACFARLQPAATKNIVNVNRDKCNEQQ